MQSALVKTFSPNTCKNSCFRLLLPETYSQFCAAYWPDHQLVCLTVLLSLPVFPAKLLLCWHLPPFTTLPMLQLFFFSPQNFFFVLNLCLLGDCPIGFYLPVLWNTVSQTALGHSLL